MSAVWPLPLAIVGAAVVGYGWLPLPVLERRPANRHHTLTAPLSLNGFLAMGRRPRFAGRIHPPVASSPIPQAYRPACF